MTYTRLVVSVLVALFAAPAWAHHKQTPPVVPFVTSGHTPLPRLASQNARIFALGVPSGSKTQIVAIFPYLDPTDQLQQGLPGNNANPAVSGRGTEVVWDTADDPLGLGLPGRQLVMSQRCTQRVLSSLAARPQRLAGHGPTVEKQRDCLGDALPLG
jgi:hypothetical protein